MPTGFHRVFFENKNEKKTREITTLRSRELVLKCIYSDNKRKKNVLSLERRVGREMEEGNKSGIKVNRIFALRVLVPKLLIYFLPVYDSCQCLSCQCLLFSVYLTDAKKRKRFSSPREYFFMYHHA